MAVFKVKGDFEMDLKIQGIPIHFPYKPYGCQLSMLNRVISALNNKQGCLLESPTGTGKTLALLCATLGWLEHQMGKGSKSAVQSDDFDDFMEENMQRTPSFCTQIPHIIYATRTHKQISQVIRELRKTKYSTVGMCILSGRTRSCINPEVRKQSNVNDACQNLKGTCPFDLGKNRQIMARRMRALNLDTPWDLEEYVEAMVKVHTCPYFFAFKLFERVPLCFCPYNYLLDPVFRETVASEISGSVIIIDEAHNIEGAARAATSVTLLEREVLVASEDLKRYLRLLQATSSVLTEDVEALINLLGAIHQVMLLTRPRLVAAGSFASSAQVWSDTEIEGLLSTVGLGVDRFETVRRSFSRLNNMIQKEVPANRDFSALQNESKSLSSATIRLFTYIFTMLKFMYRAVLMEVVNFERQPPGEDLEISGVSMNRWPNKTRSAKQTRLVERKSLSLNFWCLNPAVCMRSLAESAHSLILASGTLAPLEALAVELGIDFPVRLEAGHVVPRQRVLASCVARGPRGVRLCATFEHQNAFVFQDEVGHLLFEACQRVPGGVLCFFPSYSLLDKMIARWESTGLMGKLAKVKCVFTEPRSSEKFDDWMAKFHDTVDLMRSSSPGGMTGAVALAVCRGKISEGLDFADNYARLVVAVGIPFPPVKDPQIEQKRAFNDTLCTSISSLEKTPSQTSSPSPLRALPMNHGRRLPTIKQIEAADSTAGLTRRSTPGVPSCVLSGSEWYVAQAYRALNQALGRCIRHRSDWGVIILAEARFVEQSERYLPGISRWLRNQFVAHERWSDLLADLSEFVERMSKVAET
ncbi:hypothetical protein TSMEX_000350 [Taenia solium]|eukprot:TsM_000634300 transcript=TsM_000634300 gene=TsM_000634300